MNMFKSRRKAKDSSDALEAPFNGQTPAPVHKAVKGLKRKNKNTVIESKPVFDLASALPGTDDFRTSLLMPNLSARFSMLREQDDPNTKVGKASDDSVLFPKRQSRLVLFNHDVLTEVPETESLYSSFRPPFADRDRSNSMGDGYDSDGGSVMSRSRPGEGNNFFAGRQKLYRFPTSSTKNLVDSSGVISGRHVYEHDTTLSQFQQYRIKEKESAMPMQENRISVPVTDGGDSSEVASPATAFSKNRGTQSSTNSNPRRSSTAATSLASEPQALRDSATDSLAGKANDNIVPAPDDNSSMTVSKQRDNIVPNRLHSPSKNKRPSPVFYTTSLRNASSPIVPIAPGLDFGFKNDSRSTSASGRYQTDSPLPARMENNEEVLASNVQPNDRGKATALGLFHKPARNFDEDQFNQRQLQMHESNMSSISVSSRAASRASNDAQRARQNSVPVVRSPTPMADDRASTPQIPPIPITSDSPIPQSNRASKASGRSNSPRPRSKSSVSSTAISSMKARVESLIRKQNAELAAFEEAKLGTTDPSENKENYALAFFDNDDEDDESDYEDFGGLNRSRANSDTVDESHIHPAFRNSYRISDVPSRKSNHSNLSKPKSVLEDDRNSSRLQIPTIETDLANQQSPVGLGGLIRTHLRQNSDKSSIMLRPDSSIPMMTAEPSRTASIASTFKTAAGSIRSDPFELDTSHGQASQRASQAPPTPTTVMSQVAQQFLLRATAMRDAADLEGKGGTFDPSVEFDTASQEKSWHEDLEPKHHRGGSSETTKERREFDEELADRRRKIREGLKSVTERDRSQSPANATKGASHTFAQSRAITDPQPKALKMLGLRNSQSGPSDDDRGRGTGLKHDARNRGPENLFSNNQTATFAQFGPPSADKPQSPRSVTPPANRPRTRDRSNSVTAERSKSRTRNREADPPVPSGRGYFPNFSQPSRSAVENSRTHPDPTYGKPDDFRNIKSPTSDSTIGLTSQSSTNSSVVSPSSTYESPVEIARPSPGAFSSGRTTPSNGRATPTSGFNRKRSVTKTMISEPTFVSSTSSVPLVHLPTAQAQAAFAPPLPLMNPRRRGNTAGDKEKPVLSPTGLAFSRSTPLETVPASPVVTDFGFEVGGRSTNSPSPRKLRKATSEGGDMAAIARQQAQAAELAQQRYKHPAIPVFPNRSATALGASSDGAMF